MYYDPDFRYTRGLVSDAIHLADPTVNYAHFDNEDVAGDPKCGSPSRHEDPNDAHHDSANR